MGSSAVTITPDAPPVTITPDAAPAGQPSAISRLGNNFLSGIGVTNDEGAKSFFEHPINTLMSSMNAQGELAKKAKDAYGRGDYKGAVMHGLNYLVPFIGQQTDKAGEQLNEGDVAGGIGRTLGVAAPILASTPQAAAVKDSATSAVSDAASAAAGKVRPGLAKVGNAATAVGESLDPDIVGLVSPRAAHALRLASKTGKIATKLGAEAAPEAAASPVTITPDAAPAELPAGFQSVAKSPTGSVDNPFQAPPRAEPVETPAEPAAAPPEPAAEPAPKITPAKVEQQISESLGNKPLQPGVSLRNQGKVPTAAAPALPDGFTPVDSTALKGYKYDPEAREFESITQGGQHYVHGDVSPEEAAAFEAAKSKGQAWSQNIRQNNPLVAKVVNGQRVAVVKPRSVIVDPDTGAPEFSDVVAAKKPQAKVAAAGADEDLTSLLQKSLDQVRGKKPPQSVGDVANVVPKPGGVMTTADPGMLTDRWGTSAKSIADTDAQIRGKSPAESQAYIDQLADAYKKGRPVEPVMETRDADNNITSVDGRHRALAAKKAGIERIPILIRRLPAAQ